MSIISTLELWNQRSFLAVNASAEASTVLIGVAKIFAGGTVYLAVLLLICVWVRRANAVRFALLDAIVAALFGLGIAQGIAAIWYHPRPFEIGLGRKFIEHAAEASFPSDHATLMFSLAIPLLCAAQTRRWGVVLLGLGLALAWARVYLGVHFPLDMFGALGVSALASLVVFRASAVLRRVFYPLLVEIYEVSLRCLRLPVSVFPRRL